MVHIALHNGCTHATGDVGLAVNHKPIPFVNVSFIFAKDINHDINFH